MGCGASHDGAPRVANRSTTDTPGGRRGGDRSVSFAVANNAHHEYYTHSQGSYSKRDSLKSLDSIDSVALLSMIAAPQHELQYTELPPEGRKILGVVRCALEITEMEVAKAHLAAEEQYEAEQASSVPNTERAGGQRKRRGPRDGSGGLDRPPTPTGYITDEPSQASTQIKRTVDDMKKKFASFFSGGNDDKDDEAPSVKYVQRPDWGEMSEFGTGSLCQASLFGGSMRGSFVSALTQSSAQGDPNNDEEEVDEKAVQRTRLWATDHLAVVTRVLELYRRKLRAVEQDVAVSETISLALAVPLPTSHVGDRISLDNAASSSSTANVTSLEVMKLFLLSFSVDPLEEMEKSLTSNASSSQSAPFSASTGTPLQSQKSASAECPDVPLTPRRQAAAGNGPLAALASKKAVGAPCTVGRGADSHLCKRNLEKLQERLVQHPAATAAEKPEHCRGTSSTSDRAPPSHDGDVAGGDGAKRGRSQSQCDENLLFQELM